MCNEQKRAVTKISSHKERVLSAVGVDGFEIYGATGAGTSGFVCCYVRRRSDSTRSVHYSGNVTASAPDAVTGSGSSCDRRAMRCRWCGAENILLLPTRYVLLSV